MVPRSCGLLITAVVAGGSGVWHRTSNATLTDSYRRCPFMMPKYMETAKHDSNCRDDAFPTYQGKIGRAPDRSSLEPLEPLAGRTLAGRTVVFMGDSLSRQHFIATACRLRLDHALLHFAADFKDHNHQGSKDALRRLRSASATFRASNATFTLRLDKDEHDAGLEAYVAARCADLRRGDVVVINEGAHYSATPGAYGERVRSALRAAANCTPLVLWRETAATHFRDGVWHGQGKCYDRTARQDRRVSGPGTYPALNALANAAAEERDIPILRVYKDSLAAGAAAHIDGENHDCLHWCLPGVPDLWATALLSKLRAIDARDAPG